MRRCNPPQTTRQLTAFLAEIWLVSDQLKGVMSVLFSVCSTATKWPKEAIVAALLLYKENTAEKVVWVLKSYDKD